MLDNRLPSKAQLHKLAYALHDEAADKNAIAEAYELILKFGLTKWAVTNAIKDIETSKWVNKSVATGQ